MSVNKTLISVNMQNKLKVLFLSSWYQTRNKPSNGDFVVRHAQAVSQIHEVFCIHVEYDRNLDRKVHYEISEKYGFKQIIVYYKIHKILRILKKALTAYYYFKAYKKMLTILGKPDILHANVLLPVGLIALLFKWRYKLPLIFTEHWTGFLKESPRKISSFNLFFSRFVAKKSSFVCPVSTALLGAMKQKKIRANYEVVYNVVNEYFFQTERSTMPDKTFVHVSSLYDEHKNITGLMRVVSKVMKVKADFKLVIIHNNDNSLVKAKMEEFGVPTSRVVFYKDIPNQEVAKHLSHATSVLQFSNYETQGCVILEALSCGTPSISSNVGGIDDFFDENCGILVEAGNEEQLEKAILNMLENYKMFNPDLMREKAVSLFNASVIAQRYSALYYKALV